MGTDQEQRGTTTVRADRFADIGRDLYLAGAVTSHGGNLSETDGGRIWITRRNSMLGRLAADDVIETAWETGASDEGCSRELIVHRAMYHALAERLGVPAGNLSAAIAHTHTRHTIVRSLIEDVIVPVDSEGLFTLGLQGVRVFSAEVTIESPEVARMLSEAVLQGAQIAVIRGHGPFAIAEDLREAMRLVSVLEATAEILDIRYGLMA